MKLHRRLVSLGLALALGMTLSGASPALATPSAAACATGWGSQPKVVHAEHPELGLIRNVRSGRHACYDRLVVDLDAKPGGWNMQYVDQVYTSGSGEIVPLRGGAKLLLVVFAPAYDADGRPTYRPANRNELVNVTGYQTFRQVALAGSFEGVTDFGLGVRARLPFRVFPLNNATGSHLVVDVAHTW